MRLKTKYFIKWKGLKYAKRIAIAIIAILLIVVLVKHKGDISKFKINQNYIGIIGVLCGSAVTGIITYFNTSKAYSRDAKRKEMESRKKEIFAPLYNNMLKVNNYMVSESYPEGLYHEIKYKDEVNSFSEWESIKKDNRSLYISNLLSQQLDQFTQKINEYMEYREKLTKEVIRVTEIQVGSYSGSKYIVDRIGLFYKFSQARQLLKDKDKFIQGICALNLNDTSATDSQRIPLPNPVAEKIYQESIESSQAVEFENIFNDLVNKSNDILVVLKFIINDIDKQIYGKVQY
ncbi:hypothetical protein WKH56_10680 [Priestia sp. SB1]|uniref:hypothetical protein n=1 Tax=Priestia sp. SB1 TaxID=3132359 RepID=UPI00317D6D24